MADITETAQTAPVVGTPTEGEIIANTEAITQEPEEVEAQPLEALTVKELHTLADEANIDLEGARRKADIIEKIQIEGDTHTPEIDLLASVEEDDIPAIPVMDYRLLKRAYLADARRRMGGTTPGSEASVRLLETALVDSGYLDQVQRSIRGSFSPALRAAYRAWCEDNVLDGDGLDPDAVAQLADEAGFEVVNLPAEDDDEDDDEGQND